MSARVVRLAGLIALALLLLIHGGARAQARDPLDVALEHVRARRAALGLDAEDLAGWRVRTRRTSRHNGVTHVWLQQRYGGLEVVNGQIGVHVLPDGRALRLTSRFVPRLRRNVNSLVPTSTATEAVESAAVQLGLALASPLTVVQNLGGPAREVRLSPSGLSRDEIPVRLMLLPRDRGRVRLAWNAVVRTMDGQHWWSLFVDARTGALLERHDWMSRDKYRVYGRPFASPNDGPQSVEVDPADPIASPRGWHDTDGVPGPESNDTSGNAVFAQEDVNGDDAGGVFPFGSPPQQFIDPIVFGIDPNRQPEVYQLGSIVNLFYWNSLLHDVFYRYGFDEGAGNFQFANFGPGGGAGDPVIADAQDGSVPNNAAMGSPPDGSAARMEMGVWEETALTVNAPAVISGTYGQGRADFGPVLQTPGVTAPIVQAIDVADANGPSTLDGCTPPLNDLTGAIALIDRGDCLFVEKVQNAEAAGAVGVVIANNVLTPVLVMAATSDPGIGIPSLIVSQVDGILIRGQPDGTVNATLHGYRRDSSLDNGVIIHEYGHGVSTRLTGGPANSSCLQQHQSGGMGEGWSDWWALALTAEPGDDRADPRGVGNWVIGEPETTAGIRRFPFSTDISVNPLTFADVATTFDVHDTGESWALALWEVFWNLVEVHGFDPDVYGGSGGNNLALQWVLDGLDMQGCEPTFTAARDAILAAELASAGGVNRCRLWTGFAKRGMGFSASSGPDSSSRAIVEAFDFPPGCAVCGDVDDGEVFDLLDWVLATRAQAALGPPLVAPEKCNTRGPADLADLDLNGLPDDCGAADLAGMREQLAGLAPGIANVCAPQVGLFL